jgi:hypothetical protein
MTVRLLCFAALLLPSAAVGQSAYSRSWGLGVSLDANTRNGARPVDLRVPIRFARHWRLEPALGLEDFSTTGFSFAGTTPIDSSKLHERFWRLSLLFGRVIRLDSSTRAYLGPRLALIRNEQRETFAFLADSAFAFHRLDKEIALVVGAEASLGTHLALGGELSAAYQFAGKPVFDETLPSSIGVGLQSGGHFLSTGGAVVVHWYLGRE